MDAYTACPLGRPIAPFPLYFKKGMELMDCPGRTHSSNILGQEHSRNKIHFFIVHVISYVIIVYYMASDTETDFKAVNYWIEYIFVKFKVKENALFNECRFSIRLMKV